MFILIFQSHNIYWRKWLQGLHLYSHFVESCVWLISTFFITCPPSAAFSSLPFSFFLNRLTLLHVTRYKKARTNHHNNRNIGYRGIMNHILDCCWNNCQWITIVPRKKTNKEGAFFILTYIENYRKFWMLIQLLTIYNTRFWEILKQY